MGGKLHDIRFGRGFLDTTPKAEATKVKKKDSLDCIKIKSLYASKEHDQWNEKATPMD